MKFKSILFLAAIGVTGCSPRDKATDAYGNFESTEVTISSEGNGKLVQFDINEGDDLTEGKVIGQIDTVQLYLKKEELYSRIHALYSKTIDIPSQINVLRERKKVLEKEQERVKNLLSAGAATQKQADDINGEIDVIEKELKANLARLEINNQGLLSEINPLKAQINELNDQIARCRIINPVQGTVLTKYVEPNEMTIVGKPLYKIADISVLFLRAYISGDQLDDIKIGQKVTVLIDTDDKSFKTYTGEITWISSKSEFTPKIVQTKKERVNLVYAIKVMVRNDRSIKIGMPGEVKFN